MLARVGRQLPLKDAVPTFLFSPTAGLRISVVALAACLACIPTAWAADNAIDPNVNGNVLLAAIQARMEAQSRSLTELRSALTAQQAELAQLRRELGGTSREVATATAPEPRAEAAAAGPVSTAPRVAAIFEQPGVLASAGQFTLEPSLQFAYASSNRVALVGYTVIPAVLVGLIDVREVKRSTYAAALTARYGASSRFEIEAKLPYVYRSDTSIGREALQSSTDATAFNASGRGIGDVEATARYQLNMPGNEGPFYVGSLRLKTRTGTDPFEVPTSSSVSGLRGEGLQLRLPSGSGFVALQPALTVLVPSDPAVFFGSLSYLHNLSRRNVDRSTDQGPERIGDVAPGGIFGFNFGMGLALNERSSFSLGYDHSAIGPTRINGVTAADSVRLQLGTLLLGYSYRIDSKRTLSLTLGAGLTRDTPDVSLSLRLPQSF